MNKILDLRTTEVPADFSRPQTDLNWIAAWILAIVFLASGFAYMAYLDHGCTLNGVMTWQGKECIN